MFRLQLPGAEKMNKFVRKEDINIGSKNEAAEGTTDANILSYHLEQGKFIRIFKAPVYFRRYLDNTDSAWSCIFGPPQGLGQPRPIGRRVPFHNDQLRINVVSPHLFQETVNKQLHAVKQFTPMVVITRYDDN
jgi:hypothetical protein